MHSIDNTIRNKIIGHGNGWCMTAADFLGVGSNDAVYQVLSRLHRKGMIRRLAQGIYDYPVQDPILGVIPPKQDNVAKAIAAKANARIQPTGAYAANLLGFDLQVPARVVYLTDGISKKLKIGNTDFVFRRTTPKNMALAGTHIGLIVQALRHIGKGNITPKIESILKKRLQQIDSKQSSMADKYAPAWIRDLIKKVMRSAE